MWCTGSDGVIGNDIYAIFVCYLTFVAIHFMQEET